METSFAATEVPEPPTPELEPPVARAASRAVSDEVRASFEAVQKARAAARRRLRRDTRRVRAVTAVCLAAIGAGAFTLVKHRRAARGPNARPMAAQALPLQEVAFPRPAEPTVEASAVAAAPADAPALVRPAGVADQPATVDPLASAASARGALATCSAAYRGHRWRAAAAACGRAFETFPSDASLAMKAAQAQHARGHYAAAGDWARRVIALDEAGTDPEAFVMMAHAESHAGRPAAAKDAYRRYLALAPRGWHASEARAALRSARARPRHRPAPTGAERAEEAQSDDVAGELRR